MAITAWSGWTTQRYSQQKRQQWQRQQKLQQIHQHPLAKYAALLFMVAVITAVLNGCTISKTNVEYKCFTKASCDNENP
jgi:cell division protein FtsL